jgi:hypothetical protein
MAVASIKLTEELTLGKETDRWKKLAIILPVTATIVSALIAGTATLISKGEFSLFGGIPWDKPTSPASVAAMPRASKPDNISLRTAQEIGLKQKITGIVTIQKRWFKFNIDDNDPRLVRVTVRYLGGGTEIYVAILDSSERELKKDWGIRGDLRLDFSSPKADTYYMSIVSSDSYSYELLVDKL